jgi:hypothetical protein
MGGSGMRVAESLSYLIAAGLFDGKADTIHMLLVDAHKTNRNMQKAQTVARNYQSLKKVFNGNNAFGSFTPRLEIYEWNMMFHSKHFERIGVNKVSLKHLAEVDQSGQECADRESIRKAKMLMDALYTSEERECAVAQGYHARPAIGAAFGTAASKAMGQDQDNSGFRRFTRALGVDLESREVKLALVGSLFGGTGASSLSSMVRAFFQEGLRNGRSKLTIGGVFMLPYFRFYPPMESDPESAIQTNLFKFGTRNALEYYNRCDLLKDGTSGFFDAIYMLGFDDPTPRVPYHNDDAQYNPPHFVELETAMAVRDFLDCSFELGTNTFITGITEYTESNPDDNGNGDDDEGKKYYQLSWQDLTDSSALKKGLGSFLRMGLLFNLYIYPNCFDGSGRNRINGFKPNTVFVNGAANASANCKLLRDFFEGFWTWCREFATSLKERDDLSQSELFEIKVLDEVLNLKPVTGTNERKAIFRKCETIIKGDGKVDLKKAADGIVRSSCRQPAETKDTLAGLLQVIQQQILKEAR